MSTNRKGMASRETLEELHRLLGEDLLARLRDTKRRPSAALLMVATRFLRDQGVNVATIRERDEVVDGIDQALFELPPFSPDGDNIVKFETRE